ncbi:MAG: S1/P1 nuclease [Chthonomonadales bacterium]|nr:S1/P1 nuclease [Chthonomonadales bacterium]
MRFGRAFLTITALLAAVPAFGWGTEGHEQVADIAWLAMKRETRRRVGAILRGGDPGFRPRAGRDSDSRRAFRRAATFPDYIKGYRKRDYVPTIYEDLITRMNSRWHPETDPLVSARERERCKSWHYYDTPLFYQGDPPAVPESSALNAVHLTIAELGRLSRPARPDRKAQCWWLYWLAHLVGDLHQPLHCAQSFRHDADGDAGGNGFRFPDPEWRGRDTSLHAYWDEGIARARRLGRVVGQVNRVDLVSSRWLRAADLRPAPAEVGDLDPAAWIAEGAALARSRVYDGIEPGATPSDAYIETQAWTCKRRAVLAGMRLARLLDAALAR